MTPDGITTRPWRRPKSGARLEAEAAAFADRLAGAEQAQRKSVNDLDTVRAELAAAQRRAERAEAEAALACQLLAELRVGPPERDGAGRRRKAGSPVPAGKRSDKPGEKLYEEQGAPTAASNPDDGSDNSTTTAMTAKTERPQSLYRVRLQRHQSADAAALSKRAGAAN